MNCASGRAFESIESAHEFVTLLCEAVAEAKREMAEDVGREAAAQQPRRLQGLQITLYSLEKLEVHIKTSARLLNDLRSLRRLLCQERAGSLVVAPKAELEVRAPRKPPAPAPPAPAMAKAAAAA